jgi:plastocyanin
LGGEALAGRLRRLGWSSALALALIPVADAAAHPGHGAEAVTIQGDAFRFSPEVTTVGVGDTVIWFWEGSLFRNHSVTSDPGQAERFDSDPQGPPTTVTHPFGSSFSHAFSHRGRFTYYCKVHPSMRGVVEVQAVPDAVPGAPRLRGLRLTGGRDRPVARFRLSERAEVVGRIAKRKGSRWRQVKSFYERLRGGKRRVPLPVKGLAHGRYRLTLVAYDGADRRSNVARAKFAL